MQKSPKDICSSQAATTGLQLGAYRSKLEKIIRHYYGDEASITYNKEILALKALISQDAINIYQNEPEKGKELLEASTNLSVEDIQERIKDISARLEQTAAAEEPQNAGQTRVATEQQQQTFAEKIKGNTVSPPTSPRMP